MKKILYACLVILCFACAADPLSPKAQAEKDNRDAAAELHKSIASLESWLGNQISETNPDPLQKRIVVTEAIRNAQSVLNEHQTTEMVKTNQVLLVLLHDVGAEDNVSTWTIVLIVALVYIVCA